HEPGGIRPPKLAAGRRRAPLWREVGFPSRRPPAAEGFPRRFSRWRRAIRRVLGWTPRTIPGGWALPSPTRRGTSFGPDEGRGRGEARRPGMSTLRYDRPHRARAVGTGSSRRRSAGEVPRRVASETGGAWRFSREARAFLSVVVPARDEVSSLPRLVEEIA